MNLNIINQARYQISAIEKNKRLKPLEGDEFSGFMQMSLAGENNEEYVYQNLKFQGDWAIPAKRNRILKEGNGIERKFKLTYHTFDLDGNKREVITYDINTAVTLSEMCALLDKYAKEIHDTSEIQLDFRMSYVVVRA